MKVLKSWLQEYIAEPLPETETLVEKLALHAFEVEGVEQVNDEDVIEVDILPNRSHDCLGHFGIAREIATLFELTFVEPAVEFKTNASVSTSDRIKLIVEDSQMVPRATKRLVTDVTVSDSPDWLRNKLETLGQRSINNIVDLTNFVMLETGQPVHAFDADKISGDITIRGAKAGEKVTTLDGGEYELEEGMLVIADDEKALDIAGIKGGNNSGIDENTTNVMLSICNFNNTKIRKTAHKLNLHTDASKRFGNGLTPELPGIAMERLSQLVHEVAGGAIAEGILDEYPRPAKHYRAGVSVAETNKLLGTDLESSDVANIFDRLGFEYAKVTPQTHIVEYAQTLVGAPYVYGASVLYDSPDSFDCSSFIAHNAVMAGYSIPRMAVDQFAYLDDVVESELQPGDIVFADRGNNGNTETISTTGAMQVRQTNITHDYMPGTEFDFGVDHNGIYLGDDKIVHASPQSDEGKVIIESLSESKAFQKIVGYRRLPQSTTERFVVTIPHERLDLRIKQDLIEEVGRVYGYSNIAPSTLPKDHSPELSKRYYYTAKIKDILLADGFYEIETYSFVKKGELEVAHPLAKDKPFLRTTLRTTLAEALEKGLYYRDLLGETVIKAVEIGSVFTDDGEYLSLAIGATGMKPGKIENLLKETVAKIEDELSMKLGGDIKNGIFECNFTKVLEQLEDPENYDDINVPDSGNITFKPLSNYPFISRDIAFWTTDGSAAEHRANLEQLAGELLVRIDLFDEFTKDDRTSYAFRLVFQSHERTLTDEDVNEIMDRITKSLTEAGYEVR